MPKIGLNEYLNITTGQLIDEMIFYFTHCPCLIFFDFFFISLTFACYVFIIAKMFNMRQVEQFTTIRHSLFKSLALIILIQIICWSTTFVCYNIVGRLTYTSNELR
uniref:7TM_GPCR_Srx domain-containing protein n=1 Tax=Meloidogyne hapla TaxID=6305 RepID=A0A1I8BHY6_MELHA